MIVDYKRAGVWIIQHGQMVDAPFDSEGKRTQQKVFSGEGIKLVPGLNTIRDAVWADISKYPDVVKSIESGILEVIEDAGAQGAGSKKKTPEVGEIESLEKYDQKKAIGVVEAMMEKDTLLAWKRREKRPMVLKVIKDQVEKVTQADAAFEKKD